MAAKPVIILDNLKKFMFTEQLTVSALAVAVQVTQGHMSQILSGKRGFSERHLYFLHQAYPKLNIEWLRSGIGSMFLPETLEEYITSEPEAAYKLVNDAEFELTEYIKELETGEQTDETKAALKQMYILLGRVQATKKKGE